MRCWRTYILNNIYFLFKSIIGEKSKDDSDSSVDDKESSEEPIIDDDPIIEDLTKVDLSKLEIIER